MGGFWVGFFAILFAVFCSRPCEGVQRHLTFAPNFQPRDFIWKYLKQLDDGERPVSLPMDDGEVRITRVHSFDTTVPDKFFVQLRVPAQKGILAHDEVFLFVGKVRSFESLNGLISERLYRFMALPSHFERLFYKSLDRENVRWIERMAVRLDEVRFTKFVALVLASVARESSEGENRVLENETEISKLVDFSAGTAEADLRIERVKFRRNFFARWFLRRRLLTSMTPASVCSLALEKISQSQ